MSATLLEAVKLPRTARRTVLFCSVILLFTMFFVVFRRQRLAAVELCAAQI
jgi:hypothetical protein